LILAFYLAVFTMTTSGMNDDQDHQWHDNNGKEEEKITKQQLLYMGKCKRCDNPLILYVNNNEYEEALLKCLCKERLIVIGRWQAPGSAANKQSAGTV
jgi:hypothetical protein